MAIATLPLRAQDTTSLRASVIPARPFIERGRAGEQYLNIDFKVDNPTAEKLSLARLTLSVLDANGHVAHQQFVGVRTAYMNGINTIPKLALGPKGSLGIFNPFYALPADLSLSRLRFRFAFETANAAKRYETSLIVEPTEYAQKTALEVPMKGRVIVYDGHDYYAHHRRIDVTVPGFLTTGMKDNPVRFADDLCVIAEDGTLWRGAQDKPENWLSYGAPVYAPGAGRVVSVGNDVPDNAMEGIRLLLAKAGPRDEKSRALGNHVVIDHGNGEFSLLAHLGKGTVTVHVGDVVRPSQQVGRIGFSGDSGTHVHLHYSFLTNAELSAARSLPAAFRDFRLLRGAQGTIVKNGRIDTGDVIQSLH